MSGIIPIKLPKLIENFQCLNPTARQEYLDIVEHICYEVHKRLEDKIQNGATDEEIAAVTEVEDIATIGYQILLNIHDPVGSFNENIGGSKDAS